MKTKVLKYLSTFGFLTVLILGVMALNVHAQIDMNTARDIGVNQTDLVTSVKNIVNFVLGILGLLAVVIIIYAGIKLTASGGNDTQKEQAKKIITYALIGLVIVALSWVIVEFVVRGLAAGETGARPQ